MSVGSTSRSIGGVASASGDNTILVAAVGFKTKINGYALTTGSNNPVLCIFRDGAAGTELWRIYLQAPTNVSTGANLFVALPSYIFQVSADNLLSLDLSAAEDVHWSISYIREAV